MPRQLIRLHLMPRQLIRPRRIPRQTSRLSPEGSRHTSRPGSDRTSLTPVNALKK